MVRIAANAMRRIYAHAGLQSFVEASGGIFIAGFLVAQGLSYPAALASTALILLSRFVMRGAILPLALRIGLRRVLLLGLTIRAASFLMLPFITGISPLLAAFLLITGVGSVFYWTGYHAYVSALGDSERGGRQVSIQQATSAMVGIVAPVTGGFLLARLGPHVAFPVIAAIQILAALPLIGAPDATIVRDIRLDPALGRFARRLYFNEGFHSGCAVVVWNLALFASLGEHFDAFGGAIAFAGLAAAAGSLFIGRLIDSGRPQHSLVIAYGSAALALMIKAAAFSSPWLAIGATALGALVTPMAATAMLSPLYDMARRSACVLRFSMATEGGWDLGCSSACLMAAATLQCGASFRLPILLGLAPVLTMALMLRHWYARGKTSAA